MICGFDNYVPNLMKLVLKDIHDHGCLSTPISSDLGYNDFFNWYRVIKPIHWHWNVVILIQFLSLAAPEGVILPYWQLPTQVVTKMSSTSWPIFISVFWTELTIIYMRNLKIFFACLIVIWVRSRRCGCQPGNKIAAPLWPDPYLICYFFRWGSALVR